MNMNLNLSLDMDSIKKLLPLLWKIQPYFVGILLIGIFGFTAYEVNNALNVKPVAIGVSSTSSSAKIVFNQATINSIKTLQPVGGDVPTGTLVTSDPFN
jgi:hypothetical protein